MKKILLIGAVLLAGFLAWFFVIRDDSPDTAVQQTEPQDFPAQYDESVTAVAQTQYSSEFGNLAFAYPSNWTVVERSDNTEDSQLLTVESPLDQNEFYFCLDLYQVGDGAAEDFTVTDADIRVVEQLQHNRHAVIYNVAGLDGLYWGATQETPQVGGTSFVNEIPSQPGYRLQTYGRFNCRETEPPRISTDEFRNSRWLHEAAAIVDTLAP
jgi:hypothetical protein